MACDLLGEGSQIRHDEEKKRQRVIRVANIPDGDDTLSADSARQSSRAL